MDGGGGRAATAGPRPPSCTAEGLTLPAAPHSPEALPRRPWHALPASEVLAYWETDAERGLDDAEAARRRTRFGDNLLEGADGPHPARILLSQFQDGIVLILLAATAVSALLGEWLDAAAIAAIVLLNGLLGFLHEYRAERALLALRALTQPRARVVRGGAEREEPAGALVPGDVVLLAAGERVPADCRLLAAWSLEVDEAALTGESDPVEKRADVVLDPDTPLAERSNLVFQGTHVVRGHARAVVVATGAATEMGRIAGLLAGAEREPTPLQRRLEELGRHLVAASLAVCALVAVLGVLHGQPPYTMLLAGVSLAVAAIPEGLPAIVTVILALGVQRMARQQAVVRRLPAVETLGCTTVICCDKTGTLTLNRMAVRRIWVTGESYAADDPRVPGDLLRSLLGTACLASAAAAGRDGGRLEVRGSPTEAALYRLAEERGLDPVALRAAGRAVREEPFDSTRKRMWVIWRRGPRLELAAKGAPEVLLPRCRRIAVRGGTVALDAAWRARVTRAAEELAAGALRVLAVAGRPATPADLERPDPDQDLVLYGLVGLSDPPRPEVPEALRRCRQAGIRVVMVTGDHRATALAVARELGIAADAGQVVEGRELDGWDDATLARRVEGVRIFARVTPEHKLRIVRALRRRGHVVAMTGDGINDAPAVKEASIGVAMGRTGTEVTREAADMVLLDDSFATIVAAVEQGRAIYANVRKVIRYLLACNLGEILVMLGGTLAGLPLPLLPIHILFVNLVTDGLPAVALGVDPPEADVMHQPPRRPDESVFSRGLGRRILVWGAGIGLITLGLFAWSLGATGDLARARTVALASLVLAQLFHAVDCRSERRSGWWLGEANRSLWGAVALSAAALAAAVHVSALQPVFHTVRLAPGEWLAVAAANAAAYGAVWARRFVRAGASRVAPLRRLA